MALNGELRVVDHVPRAFVDLVRAEAPSTFALSGGDTARECYELLSVADVDWSRVSILFGDERWVPISDADSNERMARFAFLDNVRPHEIHSLREAGDTIESAAANYDALLRRLGSVDFAHLGLGPDGHTCSLFPGSPSLEERDKLVIPTGDDKHPHPRLTFTYPALEMTRLVVFTIAGADKKDPLARIQAGEDFPAARVRADRIIWLADHAAVGA
jgi:6-phosphogluconolactonase